MTKFTRFACFALTAVVVNSHAHLLAEEPQGVVRTFAVFGAVDFTSEDSVLLKVGTSNSTPIVRHLITGDGSYLDNSTWFIGSPSAMYITKGEGVTNVGSFAWLVDSETPEPPPTGSVTLTGPEALLIQEAYHVYVDQNFIYASRDENDGVMTIVTAVFSR